MLKEILLVSMFLLTAFTGFGQSSFADPDVSEYFSDGPVCSLRSCANTSLESRLEIELTKSPELAKLIKRKKLSVGIVDMSNPEDAQFAAVNGDEMMYAASLPKIAVLLAAMDAIEKGELEDTEAVRSDMKLMISRSNNRATTRMIDRVGYAKIEAVLTDPKYRLYDENYGGGLWVGKRYAAAGDRNPDPLKGLSHAATASQVCRFYYLMAMGQLVSKERSEEMLDIMADPALHHKFVNTLDKIAPAAKLFRKSGSWKQYHSDSVLVWGPDRRYILVALVDDPKGESIIRKLVTSAEKVLEINP